MQPSMKYLTARGAHRAVVGLAATAFVFGPALAWSMGVTPKAIENRALSPAPDASKGWDALDDLSPWATDHLPGRARAVHLNAWVDYYALGQLPAPQQVGPKGTAKAPSVVRGTDGYLFYGADFTVACDKSAKFEQSLKSLAGLAEIIQASGRRVVFTVAPNKSAVATAELPRAMPRGTCAARGIERQNRLLDSMRHPLFVGIRKPLADAHASGKQVFLRTDTHWTTLGGAMYAQALAAHLDPELARRLRWNPEQMTKAGELTTLAGLTATETVMSASISSGATATVAPKPATYGKGKPVYQPDSWVSRPSKGLVQGRTLLLGDSFTAVAAIKSLQPLFAQGRFVLFGYVPESQLVSEIRSADTVVIEVVERYVVDHVGTTPRFQKQVAAALGVRKP